MQRDDVERLCLRGILTELDVHFASFISGLCPGPGSDVWLAAALASNATRKGHICLDLATVEAKELLEADKGRDAIVCPRLDRWIRVIKETPVVGRPGAYVPLVLDDHSRLYLYRYWEYQERLAGWIKQRVDQKTDVDLKSLKAGLDRFFPGQDGNVEREGPGRADWQKIAAFAALVKKFCVISGGPGTGKTTTAAKILALMLEQPGSASLRIALAAPTGKAAARLQEAMRDFKQSLDVDPCIRERIPEEAFTIHRLLGSISGSPYFRHDESNPLAVDVAVVDEASMVDLALMSKLVQALPAHARLILLGDKDQLASVEAGAVLGDMCDDRGIEGFSVHHCSLIRETTGYQTPIIAHKNGGIGIADCVVGLQKNFRFNRQSGIGALSRAVNAGQGERALALFVEGTFPDLARQRLPAPGLLSENLKPWVVERFADCFGASCVEESFTQFDRFRILCALREGPYGVVNLNGIVEDILIGRGLIAPHATWYRGRPVIINRNDYNLGLFNGDVGMTWPDPETRGLRVFFPASDGGFKKFHPVRLPEHETVFAMTVHKSQGSEFDEVLLVLPDRDVPVLTRELLYTGITRARRRVALWAGEDVVMAAVSRRIRRMSGLRHALWEPTHGEWC